MKTFLAFALIALVSLTSAHADIPAPKPASITVSNIAAFPQYKFLYHAREAKAPKPIVDGQPFTVLGDVTLLVQNGQEPAQEWEKVRYDWRGGKVAIKVESVKQDGKQIAVTFKRSVGDAAAGKKTAAIGFQWVPLFTLAGMSACALVIMARRRPSRS
jgi:hypothetical protein